MTKEKIKDDYNYVVAFNDIVFVWIDELYKFIYKPSSNGEYTRQYMSLSFNTRIQLYEQLLVMKIIHENLITWEEILKKRLKNFK